MNFIPGPAGWDEEDISVFTICRAPSKLSGSLWIMDVLCEGLTADLSATFRPQYHVSKCLTNRFHHRNRVTSCYDADSATPSLMFSILKSVCFTVAVMAKHVQLTVTVQIRTNINIFIFIHHPRKWRLCGFTLFLTEMSLAWWLLHERANEFSLGCFLNDVKRRMCFKTSISRMERLPSSNLEPVRLPIASRLQFIMQVSRLSHIKLMWLGLRL